MTDLRQPLSMHDLIVTPRERAPVLLPALVRFGHALFAAMMESREREARQVIARYAHLVERSNSSSLGGDHPRAGGGAS
jgi:hypothetical protein